MAVDRVQVHVALHERERAALLAVAQRDVQRGLPAVAVEHVTARPARAAARGAQLGVRARDVEQPREQAHVARRRAVVERAPAGQRGLAAVLERVDAAAAVDERLEHLVMLVRVAPRRVRHALRAAQRVLRAAGEARRALCARLARPRRGPRTASSARRRSRSSAPGPARAG